MRRNCRFHGEVICIKNGKYGSMYVPKEESAPKEGKKPSGDNALDRLREDIERIKDENIKRNRDNLDAMYNIDMRNMSSSMKRLFASWSDGIKKANASVETIANSQEAVVKLVAQYDENIAAIQATANANSASITSLTQWKSEVNSSIQSTAQIQQTVKENAARISLLVNSNGDDLSESAAGIIAEAIAGEKSLVKIIADNVELTGYVKFTDLGDEGTASISGNRIYMNMPDDKTTSQSFLCFNYGGNKAMGYIRTKNDGADTDTESQYALVIYTRNIQTESGTKDVGLKLDSSGSMSLESYGAGHGIYMYAMGYCTINAKQCARIRANKMYDNITIAFAENDYVFASDGIYYNGRLLIST